MRIRDILGEDTGHIQQDILGVGTEIFDPRDPDRRGQSPLEPSGLMIALEPTTPRNPALRPSGTITRRDPMVPAPFQDTDF